MYTYTTLTAGGCVHTATLNLTINQSTGSTNTVTACNSYTWPVNGATYTVSGSYTYTTLNAQGCPHVNTLFLTIHQGLGSTATVTACNQYTWAVNGQTYTASGVYKVTSLNANGCINTATLNLTIHNSTSSTVSVSACKSYTWPDNVVT